MQAASAVRKGKAVEAKHKVPRAGKQLIRINRDPGGRNSSHGKFLAFGFSGVFFSTCGLFAAAAGEGKSCGTAWPPAAGKIFVSSANDYGAQQILPCRKFHPKHTYFFQIFISLL